MSLLFSFTGLFLFQCCPADGFFDFEIKTLQQGIGVRSHHDIIWCNLKGEPADPATQKALKWVSRVSDGNLYATADDVVFRDPKSFVAGEIHYHYDAWNLVSQGYHKRKEILRYITDGVSVHEFFTPFKRDYKGQHYNSKLPPCVEFSNNKSCETFDQFVTETILERLRNGSISVWGKCGQCTPPHIVMPLTVEPTKPRLCHDERYLNLWMNCPKIKFDPITDLPRYVGKDHYQAKLDDKSGYDHIKLTQESKTFFGLRWKNWYFVYNTIPFGWSPSAYIYQTVGLAVSHFTRSNGVPVTQYIDHRHIGQLQSAKTVTSNWSDLELANTAVFITALTLVSCGYFIGLQKSVLCPTQSILFLGLISNSQDQSFSTPQDKKEKFAGLRESIICSKNVSVKTLQRFAGKAVSFSPALPAARLYTREVNTNISSGIKNSRPVLVSERLRKELEHWRLLDNWEGSLRWKDERHLSIMLCSDASNSGWAGVLSLAAGSKTTRDYWCPEEKAVPIALREAKALHNTLVAFASDIFNTRVDAYVDNMNLLNFWNNAGGKNLSLTDEIKTLFLLCLNLNVSLNLYYLPSKCMPADAPSRFSSDIDCCLSESSWRLVDRTFGPHTVDMIAIPSNVRADSQGYSLKFFSPFPCEGSSGINVFSQQLSPAEIYYVFPPFVLIGPLLKFLLPCQAPTTIVIPDISPRKFWWPIINKAAESYIQFGKKGEESILMFPPTKTKVWHTKPLPWDLYAFKFLPSSL